MEPIAYTKNEYAAQLFAGHYGRTPRAFVRSFGCQQNVNDGERLKGVLFDMGFVLDESPDDADLIVFNTCAVREHAEQRAFVIIGGADSEIAYWRAWLAERGCAQNVSFIGKRPPDILPCYLAGADILLSPRVAGVNTPLKLLDYLKVSRGIVATDHPANRLILDETTAELTPLTAEGFADGIVRLARDSERRARLAANCRRLIDERYNFNVFRENLKTVYDGL